jgi:hypothetical protein
MSRLPEPPSPLPTVPAPSGGFHAGRFVLGAVIVVVGIAALLAASGVSGVPWKIVLPSALIAIGAGLTVAGMRSGHAQAGLIALGVVLTVVLAAASVADVSFEGGVGQKVERPATTSALKGSYALAVGELDLDLTDLPVPTTPGSTRKVEAHVGIGQLVVTVPVDALVTIMAHASVGQVTVFGESSGGFDVDKSLVPKIPAGAFIAYALDLRIGIGQVVVQHG